MQAKETKLQDIIEGTKQYVVPLFQRPYSWTTREWEMLWDDLVDLCGSENPKPHFIGSIVNMPTTSVPEGVAKYLLIDGQQRLTTIFIILTLLRNKARETQNIRFADEINNTLLVNQYKDGIDYFKLLPTQTDRTAFKNLINGDKTEGKSQIIEAYLFFERKYLQNKIEPELFKKTITGYFSVVSIVLGSDDNPYLVFESLNAKGRPLNQADLIRNFFFMRIHVDQQEEVYKNDWLPMQDALNDDLTEFIRHYLMKEGNIVRQNDVYQALKDYVSNKEPILCLKDLKIYSSYYRKLKYPEYEMDLDLKKGLVRLNRIEVTTAYPLLLNIYHQYQENLLSKEQFVSILEILENFLIRRFICNYPNNQYNKIFPTVFSSVMVKFPNDLVLGIKNHLQAKGYPKDVEFIKRFKEVKLYGSGERNDKTKLIFESFEEFYGHKEVVLSGNLTIEHVMPQTLTDWWKEHLGESWAEIHELSLHTIGNLTLTGYNPELSNENYPVKKGTLTKSNLVLNKYFSNIEQWRAEEIEARAVNLSEIALNIWSYFGDSDARFEGTADVTGTIPVSLKILGQSFEVNSWRDIFDNTLNVIADLEPEKFEKIASYFPSILGKDENKFRAKRKLKNGYYIEVNLAANSIAKYCQQIIEQIELSNEDWVIEYKMKEN
ncbi:MAG: DUF262 domain-containing HNH endonuclease family protein [Bacteroidetes bacterium]|nr:DUF262 domain-containing HNH endonuclease family protein [Bacteroidota bacterium]